MIKNIYIVLISLLCLFFAIQAILGDILLLKHPLILIFAGFVLTGIIGQILIGKIQSRNWKDQFEVEKLNRQIKETKTIHEHISLLLDKRIYRSRRLYYSFNDRDVRKINNKCKNCFEEFNDILYEWNDSLNSNIAKVYSYFGEKDGTFFQGRLCADLRWIGILLRRYYFDTKDKPSLKNINKAIDITNERIYKMNKNMLLKIKELEDKLGVNKG